CCRSPPRAALPSARETRASLSQPARPHLRRRTAGSGYGEKGFSWAGLQENGGWPNLNVSLGRDLALCSFEISHELCVPGGRDFETQALIGIPGEPAVVAAVPRDLGRPCPVDAECARTHRTAYEALFDFCAGSGGRLDGLAA